MLNNITKTKFLEPIFSPVTGEPVEIDGKITVDDSLLFVHYGMGDVYAYISPFLSEFIDADVESLGVKQLISKLNINNSFVIGVDTDWDGFNYYGFKYR